MIRAEGPYPQVPQLRKRLCRSRVARRVRNPEIHAPRFPNIGLSMGPASRVIEVLRRHAQPKPLQNKPLQSKSSPNPHNLPGSTHSPPQVLCLGMGWRFKSRGSGY